MKKFSKTRVKYVNILTHCDTGLPQTCESSEFHHGNLYKRVLSYTLFYTIICKFFGADILKFWAPKTTTAKFYLNKFIPSYVQEQTSKIPASWLFDQKGKPMYEIKYIRDGQKSCNRFAYVKY